MLLRRKVTLRKGPSFARSHCERAARRSQVHSAKKPSVVRKDTLRKGPSVGGKLIMGKGPSGTVRKGTSVLRALCERARRSVARTFCEGPSVVRAGASMFVFRRHLWSKKNREKAKRKKSTHVFFFNTRCRVHFVGYNSWSFHSGLGTDAIAMNTRSINCMFGSGTMFGCGTTFVVTGGTGADGMGGADAASGGNVMFSESA